ncbi:hypothetical protein F4809DRAFT_565762 [Biscogniauxia mediterranea]|nr:hypothetical protein F4809DRAFT_565762 [Biscogniauxia mediterranea]
MDSGSPTTTTSSTNRGGRPKDWTDTRVRKLIRLYTYTKLPFTLILDILESLEHGVWKPGKDAANKVKNALLGNDPRWVRPRDSEEEARRIAGLKNSTRAKKHPRRTTSSYAADDHDHLSLPQRHGPESADDITLTHSHPSSFDRLVDLPTDLWDLSSIHDHINSPSSSYPTSTHDDTSMSYFSPGFFAPLHKTRRDTGLTSSTDISMSSGIKAKIQAVSKSRPKDIMRIVKRFTLEHCSENEQSPVISPSDVPNLQFQSPLIDTRPHQHELAIPDEQDARHAVPGDFLRADIFTSRHHCHIQSPSHKAGTCWCRIAGEISQESRTWEDLGVLPDIFHPNLARQDSFGNTVFHHYAASAGIHDSFIRFISEAIWRPELPVRATNTAGQTFLHVLHPSWFADEPRFRELLKVLGNVGFDIFAHDVYGRNVFHLLRYTMGDSARFPQFAHDGPSLNRRDAFGTKPMASRASRSLDPNVAQASHSMSMVDAMNSPRADVPLVRINIPSENEDTSRIRQNTALLELITRASSLEHPNPQLEDAQGRNGLHCLAEVDLDIGLVRTSSSSSRHSRKRKYSEDIVDPSSPQQQQQQQQQERPHNSRRVQLLEGLIHAGLDANQYDENGYTPLMAFVTHCRDESREGKADLENMIRMLVRRGGANLEARNREGETALHIAARRGQKVALKELIDLGANPNVRNAQGLGVLAVIDEFWRHTERDGGFGARLEVCRGLVTGRAQERVLQKPGVMEEWGVRRG